MPPAKKAPAFSRVNGIITTETAARVDEARAELRRQGVTVSLSGLIEIALLELIERRDLTAILRRHGAKLRRD